MENTHKMNNTPIGLIPEGWSARPLGDLCEIHGRIGFRGYTKADLVRKGEGAITFSPSDIYNQRISYKDCDYISWAKYTESPEIQVKEGDILFCKTASIGKCAQIWDLKEKATINPQFVLLNDFKCNSSLLYYMLAFSSFQNRVLVITGGSSIPTISQEAMKKQLIPIPDAPEEQRRIADTLLSIDKIIGALDEAITKKRQIKEGLMQQLLTGEAVIPGFSGEWQNKRVGDIGFTYSGLTGKTKNDFGHGEAQYITFLNVLNNPVLKTDVFEKVDVRSDERQNAAKKGDLFFNTSSETPEEVGICALLSADIDNLYLNSFCFGFRLTDPDVDGLYLSYFWRSKQGREIMSALAQGATRYNLSKEYFNKAIITLPPIELQRYYANTITAADKGIAELEQKRDKYLLIKQGMIQELLTGKTRLV